MYVYKCKRYIYRVHEPAAQAMPMWHASHFNRTLTEIASLQTELHQMGTMVTNHEFKNLVTMLMPASWNPWLSTYSQQHVDVTSQTVINTMKGEWRRCQGMPAAEQRKSEEYPGGLSMTAKMV